MVSSFNFKNTTEKSDNLIHLMTLTTITINQRASINYNKIYKSQQIECLSMIE